MRDDKQISDSEISFDPANPNAGPILSFKTSPENIAIALGLGKRISDFVNRAARGRVTLDPNMVAADLVALHCNGRSQDFQAWLKADIADQCREYSLIYYNFDRRLGRLPSYIRLQFDKTA